MQSKPLIRLTPHRRARLIAWTLAMLAWVNAVFFDGHIMSRRRLSQRGGFLSLDRIARVVTQLITLRAAELAGFGRGRKISFRRRGGDFRPRHLRRSAIGARIRRALKHRDVGQRIARITAVLNALDLWAAYFAERLARRFTKLWAIAPCPCAEDRLASAGILTLRLVDTS